MNQLGILSHVWNVFSFPYNKTMGPMFFWPLAPFFWPLPVFLTPGHLFFWPLVFLTSDLVFLTPYPPVFSTPEGVLSTPCLVFLTPDPVFLTPCLAFLTPDPVFLTPSPPTLLEPCACAFWCPLEPAFLFHNFIFPTFGLLASTAFHERCLHWPP